MTIVFGLIAAVCAGISFYNIAKRRFLGGAFTMLMAGVFGLLACVMAL